MDLADIQMTLAVALVVLAAAVIAFCMECRRKKRPQAHQHRVKVLRVVNQRTEHGSEPVAIEYRPVPLRKPIGERSFEPIVFIPAPEHVAIAKMPPSPSVSSRPAELPAPAFPPVTIDTALFEQMISAPSFPAGMIHQSMFDALLKEGERFSGLVVSIGIHDSDSSMWHSRGFMQRAANYIGSLLRQDEFASRTEYDEFVIACPAATDAHWRGRLREIAERLCDYQLRNRAGSVLFSWSGGFVKDELLADAIRSATERMRETKRNGPSAESGVAHSLAV
jgi:hypothetical protein